MTSREASLEPPPEGVREERNAHEYNAGDDFNRIVKRLIKVRVMCYCLLPAACCLLLLPAVASC